MTELKNILIPLPKKIEQTDGSFSTAPFGGTVHIIARGGAMAAEGAKHIEEKLASLASVKNAPELAYRIVLTTDETDPAFAGIDSGEAYFLRTGETETVLCGKTEAGTFYAAVTLCQMLSLKGGTVLLPRAYILDYPDLPYRGHFFECRYGTEFMSLADWKEAVDYLAESKCNHLNIGVYGCWGYQYDSTPVQFLYLPLKKYPQLKTEKTIKYYSVQKGKWIHKEHLLPTMYEEDFLPEIIRYAKKKNITVSPTFNSLGHNTLLPRTFPEMAAKEEDGTPKPHGFCTKNEKTFEILYSIYDEIIDRYLKPEGLTEFAIGLDEVGDPYKCRCPQCVDSTHAQLMVDYMIRVCKYLKSRGMTRIYVYHDMLFHEFDVVNEDLKQRLVDEDIYNEVILDWWTYEDPSKLFWGKADKVNGLFRSHIKPYTGYYSWCLPTEHTENIRACLKLAKQHGFEGMVAYGTYDLCYDKNFLTLSEVAWNTDTVDDEDGFNKKYARRTYPRAPHGAYSALQSLGDIMKDDNRSSYFNRLLKHFEYYFYSYRVGEERTLKNFPGDGFNLLREKGDVFVPYLMMIREKVGDALSFLENAPDASRIHDQWLLTARQYYADADEYLTVYNLWQMYSDGASDAVQIVCELKRLIAQREKLMAFAETVKARSAGYTYLRNMSLVRQFLMDLCQHFEEGIRAGTRPDFDIFSGKITGAAFDFLR